MSEEVVAVNRAPVLTLWAAVVAERLGNDWSAALTLGRAVAGLNAQAKGRALGIYHAREPAPGESPSRPARGEQLWVSVCGRSVPARETPDGLRAVSGEETIEPESVERDLERAFGDRYGDVRQAMEQLAASLPPERLEAGSYDLYERFRPKISPGRSGWGQKGALDLGLIRSLARRA